MVSPSPQVLEMVQGMNHLADEEFFAIKAFCAPMCAVSESNVLSQGQQQQQQQAQSVGSQGCWEP